MNDQISAPDAEAAYATNSSLDQIAERLRRGRRVAILTHSKPDGDAVGSSLALARTLARLEIRSWPVYMAPWQSRLEPLVRDTPVVHDQHGCWKAAPLNDIDTVAIVDTGSWSQLADARHWLGGKRDISIIIDHHAHGDGEIAHMRFIDPRASAAAQILTDLCLLLLGLSSASDLPVDIAEALYVGLATDTGWFRYSNTTPVTLRTAADLLDAGVDHHRLYRWIEQSETPTRLELIRRALENLEVFEGGRVAVITLDQQDIEATGATQDELGGLTDLPQSLATVRAVAVITPLEADVSKVSFRSKTADDPAEQIDVNQVARSLGGGGHVHAAGAKIAEPIGAARERVIGALRNAVRA